MTRDRRYSIVAFTLVVLLVWSLACAGPAVLSTPEPTAAVTLAAVPSAAPPPETEKGLTISSQNGFTDGGGGIHVVGEVYNSTDANYQWIKIACSFYAGDGRLLAQEEDYAYIDILLPGERAPFRVSLWEPPAGVNAYYVSASGYKTEEQPFTGIEFVQNGGLVDENNITIIGEVVNTSETPASQVRIAAALYDQNGTVLDVGFTYAYRDVLFQDSISPFKLFIAETNVLPDQYKLIAYAARAPDDELGRLADIALVSTTHYTNTLDELVIIGEVVNRSTERAAFVKALASFYNENNALVAADWRYVWANILGPGERSPFGIDLVHTPADVDHWQVWVEGERTDEQVAGNLALLDTNSVLDENGVAIFTGEVKNNGDQAMIDIQVAVVVYDADGQLITAHWTRLEGDLAPGQTMPFALQVETGEDASSFEPYVQGRVKSG
jgi:hypothetical protein